MATTKLIEWLVEDELLSERQRLLQQKSLPKIPQAQVQSSPACQQHRTAKDIVEILLDGAHLCEATVHRPRRGSIWVATYTGAAGGQVWRSTGLTDRAEALLLARRWEAQARAERAKAGRSIRKPALRVRHSGSSSGAGLLTQDEVALLLNISERAVRKAEHSALAKLRRHPLLRHVWEEYLTGTLDEEDLRLTAAEIQALFSLARSPIESQLMEKILLLVQQ